MYGVTRKDKINNITILEQLGLASVSDKIRENRVR